MKLVVDTSMIKLHDILWDFDNQVLVYATQLAKSNPSGRVHLTFLDEEKTVCSVSSWHSCNCARSLHCNNFDLFKYGIVETEEELTMLTLGMHL